MREGSLPPSAFRRAGKSAYGAGAARAGRHAESFSNRTTKHMRYHNKAARQAKRQAGTSIVETVIASAILLFGVVPVMGLFSVATRQNAKQGDFATRTIEYS